MTTKRQFGSVPTTAERLDRALELIAALQVHAAVQEDRIVALERKLDVAADEDGPPPEPLGLGWLPIKQAAALLGFSQSGLRKHIKRWNENAGYIWWTYRGGRLFVDVDAAPIRAVRT